MKKIFFILILAAVALFLFGCTNQGGAVSQQTEINEKNISYFSNGQSINAIECSPKNVNENTPAIVLTGGDGVTLKMLQPVCEAFANEGIIALAHDNVNGSVMGSIGAISSAVDFLKANDSNRKISLWAHSSGTIFSFFAAYEKPEIKTFVETSGHFQIPICDVRQAGVQDPNCAAYLNEFPAPILIVHGQNDSVVSVQFAYAFAQRLEGVKKPYQMIIVPDAKHEFMNEREGVIKQEAQFVIQNSK